MGYDLHVTRADNWESNVGQWIREEEWLRVIRDDPELDADPANGPYSANWLTSRRATWFDWSDGNVYTTDPDRDAVGKLLDIAFRLRAGVQGDNGENYQDPTEWTVPGAEAD